MRYGGIAVVASQIGLGIVGGPALAQPVFHDDFSGATLAPHWTHWILPPFDYRMGDGRMTVTAVHAPAGLFLRSGGIVTTFAPLADFRVTTRLGWEAGTDRRLYMEIGGGLPRIYLSEIFEFGIVYSTGISGTGRVPAPPAGTYEFTVVRSGGRFGVFLNGTLLSTYTDTAHQPLSQVGFVFDGPISAPLSPMWLDEVTVVPSPATPVSLVAAALLAGRRRRKTPGNQVRR